MNATQGEFQVVKGSFRPLAGFWFLNNTIYGTHPIIALRFRPLAGFWFLNDDRVISYRRRRLVSVPLRGSGS